MKAIEVILVEYELARAKSNELKKLRSELINKCINLSDQYETGQNRACHEIAHYHFYSDDNKFFNGGRNFVLTYDEVLAEYGCDSCNKARSLKVNEIAEAKKKFGNAKRALSARAKYLMDNGM